MRFHSFCFVGLFCLFLFGFFLVFGFFFLLFCFFFRLRLRPSGFSVARPMRSVRTNKRRRRRNCVMASRPPIGPDRPTNGRSRYTPTNSAAVLSVSSFLSFLCPFFFCFFFCFFSWCVFVFFLYFRTLRDRSTISVTMTIDNS